MLVKREAPFSREKFYYGQGSTMYDKKVLSKSVALSFYFKPKNTKLLNHVVTYRGQIIVSGTAPLGLKIDSEKAETNLFDQSNV